MSADLPHSAANISFAHQQQPAVIAPYMQQPIPPENFIADSPVNRGALRADLLIAKSKIEEFAAMPEGWDGYGALVISDETRKNALRALEIFLSVAPTPDITPNSNGTISLEWESHDGSAHLEIGRTKFSFYIKPRSGKPIFVDGQVEQLQIALASLVTDFLFPPQRSVSTITKISFPSYVRSPY